MNRETIYRYIWQGKLVAAKLGRTYRISKWHLDLLLTSNQIRREIPMRDYTPSEIAEFLRVDQLDREARSVSERFKPGETETVASTGVTGLDVDTRP